MGKFTVLCGKRAIQVNFQDNLTLGKISEDLKLYHGDGFYVLCNGKIQSSEDVIQPNRIYHVVPRVLGGKGGFGSMLRAIGAQIEKTTNHEACRDINGRRMRDVNNEKKIKEWLSKKVEMDKKKEEERQERLARRRAMPNHKFEDPTYDEQRKLVAENQEDALAKGIAAASSKFKPAAAAGSADQLPKKRKADGMDVLQGKKTKQWLGIDLDENDLTSEESGDEASPVEKLGLMEAGPSCGASCDSTADCPSDNSSSEEKKLGKPLSDHIRKDNKPQEYIKENCVEDGEKVSEAISISGTSGDKQEQDKVNVIQNETSTSASLTCVENNSVPNISLEDAVNAADLEALGMDKLKSELMARGMKCGGTLQERAQRLFSVKGVALDQIDPSLLAKGKKKPK